MHEPGTDESTVAERVAAIENAPLSARASGYQDLYAELSARLETIDDRSREH